jgi:hypothetical protein
MIPLDYLTMPITARSGLPAFPLRSMASRRCWPLVAMLLLINQAWSATWTVTGPLATARSGHTSTLLLASGKVLVAGGSDVGGNALSSCEFYDPAAGTGTWFATGSLATARNNHTATRLLTGEVLVTGGGGAGGVLSSCELYNPAAGTWSAVGDMSTARWYHTATLLPSGQVLVAGGHDDSDYLSSCELYDPSGKTWSAAGPLAIERAFHTATSLLSGEVLVVGGNNVGETPLPSCELYNPTANTWSATGSLLTARQGNTAVLLPSGQVLVAGGQDDLSAYLSSCEVYDPTPPGTWSATGALAAARSAHTATLLPSDKVLVAGGFGGGALSSCELYDPVAATWSTTGSMTIAREGAHTATLLLSGQLMVAGGYSGSSNLSSCELYEPRITPTITWATPSAIPYDTALSVTQLNATTSVPGSFVYAPASGIVLAAGSYTLSATFTPTDTVHYTKATAIVSLTVNQALPTVTWTAPAAIAYHTALSTTQLNATTSVPGSFVYAPASGIVLAAGSYMLSTTFTPTDTANYLTATATVSLTVNQVTPTITWAAPAAIIYGTALSATQLNATASVPGSLVYSPAIGNVPAAGNRTLSATFTPTDTVNYATATATVSLTVNQAPLTVTAADTRRAIGAPNPIFIGALTGVVAGDGITATYASSADASTVVGTYGPASPQAITPTLADPNGKLDNYTVTATNGTLTITLYSATVTLSGLTATYDGAAHAATATTTPVGLAVTITYDGLATVPTNAGNYVVVAITDGDYAGSTAGLLVIAKAPLSVIAANAERAKSMANPVFTGTLTGVVAGDGITATYASSADATTAVGTYGPASPQAITPTLVDPNGKLPNYTVTTTNGTLTILLDTPTITWATPSAITYGTALSATQLSAVSVPGAFVYSPASGNIPAAGSQTLSTTFTPTDTVNYTTATATVSLTVSKAPLTVTAADARRAFGAANPSFIGILSGVIADDGITVTYASSANATTAAGIYGPASPQAITPTLVDPNGKLANYTVTVTNGTLTITIYAGTVTLSGLTATYDGAAHAATATTDPAGLAVTITYDGTTTAPTEVGSYAVVATINDPAYSGSTTGTLVIAASGSGNAAAAIAAKGGGPNKCGLGSGFAALLASAFLLIELRRRR